MKISKMKSINDYLEEGRLDYLNKTIEPFEQSCCQQGIAMYYAYILKHDENVGNGMASLEQLEKVYNKIGGGSVNQLKKHAEKYKDIIK